MSTEVIRRITYGKPGGPGNPVLGIATTSPVSQDRRGDHVRVLAAPFDGEALEGYAGIVTSAPLESLPRSLQSIPAVFTAAAPVDHIHNGDVLRLDPHNGAIRSLFRIGSSHNTIFATDRCNSRCLMCSQPPKDVDDSELVQEHLRLVELIPPTTPVLGITGGEPTLLGEGLFRLLGVCRDRLPSTHLHMLTNGRLFKNRRLAERLSEVNHPSLVLGIPLYSDIAEHHDYVVQAKGAFDETVIGLHQLAGYGQRIEVRVVVHRQTYRRLLPLAQYIYRNCPFVEHVAFMGLEIMGYTKANLNILWIDPVEYQEELEAAVSFLDGAGMHVSIYNHPLCVLRRTLWPWARRSISDWKNIYLDACSQCGVLDRCGGLFKSAERVHSEHIAPLAA